MIALGFFAGVVIGGSVVFVVVFDYFNTRHKL